MGKELGRISTEVDQDTKKLRRLSNYQIGFGQLIFTVVGSVVGVAALLFTYYLIPRYSLAVVTLTRSSLVNIASAVADDVQVTYQGNPIPNLVLVQTKLENTGNQPIRAADFDQPLEFGFPADAQVVEAEVIDSRLVQFPPTLTIISNTVQVSPYLLNPQARLVLQFIVTHDIDSQAPLSYTVRSSIANILDTTPVDAVDTSDDQGTVKMVIWSMVSVVGLGILSILFYMWSDWRQRRALSQVGITQSTIVAGTMYLERNGKTILITRGGEVYEVSPADKSH